MKSESSGPGGIQGVRTGLQMNCWHCPKTFQAKTLNRIPEKSTTTSGRAWSGALVFQSLEAQTFENLLPVYQLSRPKTEADAR